MANFRLKPNRAGIRSAALNTGAVRAAVMQVAEGIASRARGVTDDEITVEVSRRKDRIGARIARENAAGEAKDRALGRSIGGA